MNDTAGLAAFFAAVAGLGLIIFFIAALLWALKSIGLSRMAENRGLENPWLAWLPIGDLYIMGAIVEEMNLFGLQITNLGLWFPVICLLGGILTGIPILGVLLFIGLLVFQIAFIYKLFSMYTDQAVVYTVLSVFFAFLWPVFVFSLRNQPVIAATAAAPDTNPDNSAETAHSTAEVPDAVAAVPEETIAPADSGANADAEEPAAPTPETAAMEPDEQQQQP